MSQPRLFEKVRALLYADADVDVEMALRLGVLHRDTHGALHRMAGSTAVYAMSPTQALEGARFTASIDDLGAMISEHFPGWGWRAGRETTGLTNAAMLDPTGRFWIAHRHHTSALALALCVADVLDTGLAGG